MSRDDIAVLRIELDDIEPLIWRRVAVRTATNLQTLHRIIQAAMGWQDYHLWSLSSATKSMACPTPRMPAGATRFIAPPAPRWRASLPMA